MEPIRETRQALDELEPSTVNDGLLHRLQRLAARAREIVPELVGVSVAPRIEDLTFTLVASDLEAAVLDAVQYVTSGPCERSAGTGEISEFHHDDVLDEKEWRLFAEATAVHPVRSTLTLPVVTDGQVVGTVNLYAATVDAFAGHHEALADVFGAWAQGAVTNADLSFETRRAAMEAPQRVRDQVVVDVAVGILAAELDVDVDVAEERLLDAAIRAGVSTLDLARTVVAARDAGLDAG